MTTPEKVCVFINKGEHKGEPHCIFLNWTFKDDSIFVPQFSTSIEEFRESTFREGSFSSGERVLCQQKKNAKTNCIRYQCRSGSSTTVGSDLDIVLAYLYDSVTGKLKI